MLVSEPEYWDKMRTELQACEGGLGAATAVGHEMDRIDQILVNQMMADTKATAEARLHEERRA